MTEIPEGTLQAALRCMRFHEKLMLRLSDIGHRSAEDSGAQAERYCLRAPTSFRSLSCLLHVGILFRRTVLQEEFWERLSFELGSLSG